MNKLVIGAPTPGGLGAKEAILAEFAAVSFPDKFLVENQFVAAQSYPEADIHVLGVGHDDHCKQVVEFKSIDDLVRIGASIESLAELHGAEAFMLIQHPAHEVVMDQGNDGLIEETGVDSQNQEASDQPKDDQDLDLDDDGDGEEVSEDVLFLEGVIAGEHDGMADLLSVVTEKGEALLSSGARKKTLVSKAIKHAEKLAKA